MEAEKAILEGGQSYKIGNRLLTRADLNEVRRQINALISQGATADDENTNGAKRLIQAIMVE